MPGTHPTADRIYQALKAHGHSPAKAAEIILDAKRGDAHAIAWVKAVNASHPVATRKANT